MTQPNPLPELPYAESKGDIRAIYDALAAALDVRLVNLVYRHIATVPGCLEWAWSTVGRDFAAGRFAARSPEILALAAPDEDAPARKIGLERCGLPDADAARAFATVDAYNRANPMNALSLAVIARALDAGRPAAPFVTPRASTEDLPALLPIAPLDALSPPTSALLQRLAVLTVGGDSPVVPSLFRHFAPWPALLEEICEWVQPLSAAGTIDELSARLAAATGRVGGEMYDALPEPPPDGISPDPSARTILLRTVGVFPPAICRMIVVGVRLRAALRP